MLAKMLASCGTKAMPRRARSRAGTPSSVSPSRLRAPNFSGSSPAIAFSRVDLPAPFGPTMATNWPGATSIRAPLRISSAAP